jgi:NTE family protein
MKFGRSTTPSEPRLSFITQAPLEQLLPRAQSGFYPANSVVCEGNQFSDAAYLLLSGGCEVRRIQRDGKPQTSHRLSPGETFGAEENRPEDARTVAVATADSVILRIDRKHFDELRSYRQGGTPRLTGSGLAGGAHRSGVLPLRTVPARPSNQVVTLVFLSEQIPAALVSHQMARLLHRETGGSVVLVRFAPYDQLVSTGGCNLSLNGEFRMAAQMADADPAFELLTVGVKTEPSPSSVASLLDELRRRFRYVLLEAPANHRDQPWVFELLARSELAYLFLEGRSGDVFQLERLMREARLRLRGSVGHLKPIACLASGQGSDGFDLLAQRVAAPVHLYVRYCGPSATTSDNANRMLPGFEADLRRLAREIGGKLVGLALSSGAAKGFAHIGVIQVLEENGIEVDVIAGSSMGAYVGSLWAYGFDGRELERLARELERRWALWSLIDPVFPPRQGFLRGFRVKKRLMRSLGEARFADLTRPFRVMATNLETLERCVFGAGEVAAAVHASIAVPGICVPIRIDGETYIDGGIADPLPVDALREMGVSKVIAVDAIPTPDRIRYALEAERELARHRERSCKLLRKMLPLDRQLNFFARGNLFEILMRSIHGAQVRVAEASCRMADLVLRPNICDDRWLDYRNPGKFMALGREIAEQHLEEIKALTTQTETTHEPPHAHASLAGIA